MAASSPLSKLTERPNESGVYTDFDGTLSPIVDNPDHARPLEGAKEVLAMLAARFARVGVISGRPVAFLQRVAGGAGVDLWGEDGLERATGGAVRAAEGAEQWRGVVEEVAGRAEAAHIAERVERKSLSVTLHFRTNPGRENEARAWAAAEAARTGLSIFQARKAVEMRPPVERDKGTALADAAAGLGAVCFMGDDRGDLAAFDALDRLAAEGVYVVRIAVRSPEMPAELEARADLVVDGPAGALQLLEELAASATAS